MLACSRPPVAGDLVERIGAGGGQRVGGSALVVKAELSLGATTGEGVNARQVIGENLPKPRRQVVLEPVRCSKTDSTQPALG